MNLLDCFIGCIAIWFLEYKLKLVNVRENSGKGKGQLSSFNMMLRGPVV